VTRGCRRAKKMFRDYLTRLSKRTYQLERRQRIRQQREQMIARYLAIPHLDLGPSLVRPTRRTYALSAYKLKTCKVAIASLINQLCGALQCVDNPEHCLFTRLMMRGTLDERDLHLICWACTVLMSSENRPYVASTLKRVHCKLQMLLQ